MVERNTLSNGKRRVFPARKGGGLSRYAVTYADGARTSGARLEALTRDEAIEWAERREIDPDQLPEDLQPEEA